MSPITKADLESGFRMAGFGVVESKIMAEAVVNTDRLYRDGFESDESLL